MEAAPIGAWRVDPELAPAVGVLQGGNRPGRLAGSGANEPRKVHFKTASWRFSTPLDVEPRNFNTDAAKPQTENSNNGGDGRGLLRGAGHDGGAN
eukprot:6651675-Pyramimonas_sp.AAC.1